MSPVSGPALTGGTDAESRRGTADDSGSLVETAAALMVMSIAAVMVLTFNVTSSRVRMQAEMRSAAVALIERHSAAARQIDCVQNAGVLDVCGPVPAAATAPPAEGNKVIKPAGPDDSASGGESGHDGIRVEWADYYQLADMDECASDGVPPRAVREITAEWSDDTGRREERRLVLGPSVPQSRGWTAVKVDKPLIVVKPPIPVPGRQTFKYDPTQEDVQVPTYGGNAAGTVLCRVLVAPPGKTYEFDKENKQKKNDEECRLDVGWNDPAEEYEDAGQKFSVADCLQ